jgi:hypothetical protein
MSSALWSGDFLTVWARCFPFPNPSQTSEPILILLWNQLSSVFFLHSLPLCQDRVDIHRILRAPGHCHGELLILQLHPTLMIVIIVMLPRLPHDSNCQLSIPHGSVFSSHPAKAIMS